MRIVAVADLGVLYRRLVGQGRRGGECQGPALRYRLLMSALRHVALPLVLAACARSASPPATPITNDEAASPAASETPGHTARIVKVDDLQGELVITVATGSNDGVNKDWHACVTEAGTICLNSGELMIVRVDEGTLVAKSYLTVAQVQANPVVRVWPD